MSAPPKQLGFSLVVVLLMLVALSLLGVTSYAVVTSSSRSAAGWSDRQRSLYLTESALKRAEAEITDWVNSGNFDAWTVSPAPETRPGYFKTRQEIGSITPFPSGSAIRSIDIEPGDTRLASGQAQYFVIYEGIVDSKPRITVYARSAGARTATNSVVSATYEVQE